MLSAEFKVHEGIKAEDCINEIESQIQRAAALENAIQNQHERFFQLMCRTESTEQFLMYLGAFQATIPLMEAAGLADQVRSFDETEGMLSVSGCQFQLIN